MATRQVKSTNYFSHDSNARNDEKLVRLRMQEGAAGYGVYFMILERLREADRYMSTRDYNMIAFDLRVDADIVKTVVEDFGLFSFTDDGCYFYSESFLARMDLKDASRKRMSEGGKRAMNKRWKAKTKEKTEDVATTEEPGERPEQIQPTDNAKNIRQFFSKDNSSNIEVLLMNLELQPTDTPLLRQAAKEVIAEWELAKKNHYSYTDWSQHLIAAMRIKIKDKNKNSKRTKDKSSPPKTPDYSYSGGFGGKDT